MLDELKSWSLASDPTFDDWDRGYECARDHVADALFTLATDPRWVCLEGMNTEEFKAYEYGESLGIEAVTKILDGVDKGEGSSVEPWNTVRRRLLVLVENQFPEIPEGWAMWSSDSSLQASRGDSFEVRAMLRRDKNGMKRWEQLSEAEQASTDLFAWGYAHTLPQALRIACEAAKAASWPGESNA